MNKPEEQPAPSSSGEDEKKMTWKFHELPKRTLPPLRRKGKGEGDFGPVDYVLIVFSVLLIFVSLHISANNENFGGGSFTGEPVGEMEMTAQEDGSLKFTILELYQDEKIPLDSTGYGYLADEDAALVEGILSDLALLEDEGGREGILFSDANGDGFLGPDDHFLLQGTNPNLELLECQTGLYLGFETVQG